MELIIIAAAAFWLGWVVHGLVLRSMIRTALRSAGIDPKDLETKIRAALEEDKDQTSGSQATVKIEKHGDILFAYEHPSDRFLGQHKDPVELINLIATKFPTGTNVTIPKELGAELIKNDQMA